MRGLGLGEEIWVGLAFPCSLILELRLSRVGPSRTPGAVFLAHALRQETIPRPRPLLWGNQKLGSDRRNESDI